MNAYELAEQLMTALATLENSAIMLCQQADRIAELEKERQGLCVFCKNRDLTPQTKPLSDEEIVEIYESVKQDKDLTWEEWCITWEEWCKEQIEFARAIEERILGK